MIKKSILFFLIIVYGISSFRFVIAMEKPEKGKEKEEASKLPLNQKSLLSLATIVELSKYDNTYKCPVQNCQEECDLRSGYVQHVLSNHRDALKEIKEKLKSDCDTACVAAVEKALGTKKMQPDDVQQALLSEVCKKIRANGDKKCVYSGCSHFFKRDNQNKNINKHFLNLHFVPYICLLCEHYLQGPYQERASHLKRTLPCKIKDNQGKDIMLSNVSHIVGRYTWTKEDIKEYTEKCGMSVSNNKLLLSEEEQKSLAIIVELSECDNTYKCPVQNCHAECVFRSGYIQHLLSNHWHALKEIKEKLKSDCDTDCVAAVEEELNAQGMRLDDVQRAFLLAVRKKIRANGDKKCVYSGCSYVFKRDDENKSINSHFLCRHVVAYRCLLCEHYLKGAYQEKVPLVKKLLPCKIKNDQGKDIMLSNVSHIGGRYTWTEEDIKEYTEKCGVQELYKTIISEKMKKRKEHEESLEQYQDHKKRRITKTVSEVPVSMEMKYELFPALFDDSVLLQDTESIVSRPMDIDTENFDPNLMFDDTVDVAKNS